uniref:Uncharacterized protein n=1 Tax=Amphimedon queenslandica TaxID=400682 RepID=A0A1X7TQQ1_AMPQE
VQDKLADLVGCEWHNKIDFITIWYALYLLCLFLIG